MIKLLAATPNDVAKLHAAVTPVLARIERNQQTRSFITAIETMSSNAAATTEPPLSCAPHAVSSPTALPNGTYTTKITAADVDRSGLSPAWAQSHFVLILKSGNFVLDLLHSNGDRETLMEGTYSLYHDHIVLTAGFNGNADKITARWSLDRNHLTFADVKSNDPVNQGPDTLIWESEPWTHR